MALPCFVGLDKVFRNPFVNSLSGTFCRMIDFATIASAFPVAHDALPAELKRWSLVSSAMTPERRLNRVDATSQQRLISPQSRTLH